MSYNKGLSTEERLLSLASALAKAGHLSPNGMLGRASSEESGVVGGERVLEQRTTIVGIEVANDCHMTTREELIHSFHLLSWLGKAILKDLIIKRDRDKEEAWFTVLASAVSPTDEVVSTAQSAVRKEAARRFASLYRDLPTERAKQLSRAERRLRNSLHVKSLVYGEIDFDVFVSCVVLFRVKVWEWNGFIQSWGALQQDVALPILLFMSRSLTRPHLYVRKRSCRGCWRSVPT